MNEINLNRCLPLFYRFNTIPDNPIYQKHDVLLAFTRWIGVTSNVKKERGLQPTSNTADTVQELCKLVTDYMSIWTYGLESKKFNIFLHEVSN